MNTTVFYHSHLPDLHGVNLPDLPDVNVNISELWIVLAIIAKNNSEVPAPPDLPRVNPPRPPRPPGKFGDSCDIFRDGLVNDPIATRDTTKHYDFLD